MSSVPAGYTQKYGRREGGHTYNNVHGQYALFLQIGVELNFNATGFADHTYEPGKYDNIFGLAMLTMAAENPELGGDYITVPKRGSPKMYQRVINAIARRIVGCATTASNALLDPRKGKVVKTRWVSLEQHQDINMEIKRVEAMRDKKLKGNVDGDGDDEGEGEELGADEDEFEALRQARRRNSSDHGIGIEGPLPDILNDRRFVTRMKYYGVINDTNSISGVCIHTLDTISGNADPWYPENNNDYGDGDDDGDGDADGTGEDQDVFVVDPSIDVESMVREKVVFTMTPIHHQQTGAKLGYLVVFMPRDPTWNPGVETARMIKTRDLRQLNWGNSRFTDPYHNYAKYQDDPLFPVYSITKNSWVSLAMRKQNLMGNADTMRMMYSKHDFEDYKSQIHPKQMFALERELARIEAAGGPNLKGAFKIGEIEGQDGKTFTWPDDMVHYEYVPVQVAWYHPENLMLSEQLFPDVVIVNPALEDDKYDDLAMTDPVYKFSVDNVIVPRRDFIRLRNSDRHIYTGNIVRIAACEADRLEALVIDRYRPAHFRNTLNKLKQAQFEGRVLAETQDIRECKEFFRRMTLLRQFFYDQFAAIYSVGVNAEYMNLPASIKALVKFQNSLPRDRFLGMSICKMDANMDLFSNMQMYYVMKLEKTLRFVKPILAKMITLYSYVTYQDSRQTGLLGNTMNGGPADDSKTFTSINGAKKQMVPGTYECITSETDNADKVETHVENGIRLEDEVQDYVVNVKPAGADRKRQDRLKAVMVDHTLAVRTIEFVNHPGARRPRREEQCFTRVCQESRICTTNRPVDSGPNPGAVLSRFHVLTSKSAGVPIDQFRGQVDPKYISDAQRKFNTHQMLIAAVYQYMTMGCTSREISLDLFDYIVSSVCAFLRAHHIVQGSQNRPVEKIRQFCRICTIEKAITHVVYAPGGKYYGKPWDPECLKEIARHCYAEEQQCIMAITWFSNELISDDWHIVMCALCAMVGIRADADTDIDTYRMYADDPDIRPRIRLKYNTLYDKGSPQTQPKHLIDLNYLMLPGQFDTICSQVSEMTNPHMAPDMVKNVLVGLEQHMFMPKGGAFAPVRPDALTNHVSRSTDKALLDPNNIVAIVEQLKSMLEHKKHNEYIQKEELMQEDDYARIVNSIPHLQAQPGYNTYQSIVQHLLHVPQGYSAKVVELMDKQCVWEHGTPKKYNRIEPDAHGRLPCVGDLTRMPDQIPVITITRRGAHAQVCFAPQAVRMFDHNIILEALEQAIICGTTKPGKRMLGWPEERDNTKFRTVEWSREFIDTFLGMVPPQRRTHILYPKRGYIDDDIAAVIYPGATLDDQDRKTMEKLNDLNKWAAVQHHWRCTNPFDEPLRDEDYVNAAYETQKRLRTSGTREHGKTNYPHSFSNKLQNIEEDEWSKSTMVVFTRQDRQKLAKLRK